MCTKFNQLLFKCGGWIVYNLTHRPQSDNYENLLFEGISVFLFAFFSKGGTHAMGCRMKEKEMGYIQTNASYSNSLYSIK